MSVGLQNLSLTGVDRDITCGVGGSEAAVGPLREKTDLPSMTLSPKVSSEQSTAPGSPPQPSPRNSHLTANGLEDGELSLLKEATSCR